MAYAYEKPCAGFDQMILDLQKIYANWISKGCKPFVDAYGNILDPKTTGFYDALKCEDRHITIKKWYARRQVVFGSRSTIDEMQLKEFCVQNKLNYRIYKYDSHKDTLYISGASWAFAQSKLNGLMVQSRERARSLQDLAQKFYESDMMKEVWKKHDELCKDIYLSRKIPCVSPTGFSYQGWTDSDGYTISGGTVYKFRDHQYRDLETEDELIAFTLAFYTRDWGTDPKGISWEHLDWYIDIEHPFSDGRMELHNMPKYHGAYLHEKPRVSDIPAPPPLKDFF